MTGPRMTPEQLATIQARVDAATEGPWKAYSRGIGYEVHGKHYERINWGHREKFTKADAEFISESRTDVPALLAYARDLEARSNLARELHRPITHHFLTPPAGSLEVCEACRWEYPCPTIAALTATEGA